MAREDLNFKTKRNHRTIEVMLLFVVAIVCLLLALMSVVLQKTYFYLPARELKRQAETHKPLAMVLWRAVAHGAELRLLLWILICIFSAVGLVLLSHVAPTVLAIIATGLLLLAAFAWIPNTRLTSLGGRLTVWGTPVVVWLLNLSGPATHWFTQRAARFKVDHHTGLYQHEDLLELLEQQKHQPDNRISDEAISLAQAALKFGDCLVREVLVPRKSVKSVSADERVSPVMLDELHKSLHARFPVYGKNQDDIVGVLYLRDVVAVNEGKGASGTVRDVMDDRISFVHEADDLSEVLHTFYQTKQQLFVVINGFEEYVGILTLEDVLRQLLGQPTIKELHESDSKQAVAARHSKQPAFEEVADSAEADDSEPVPAETEDEPAPVVSETPDEVVE